MKDFIERLEGAAESRYFEMIQPDGKFRCDCGELFDPENEGGVISPNPYAMPSCSKCFEIAFKESQ